MQYFLFSIKRKLFKNYQKCFLFYQKSSFWPWDFQICVLHSPPFFSFHGICWFYWRSWLSLWHHNVLKLDFKNADSLISVELKFWFGEVWLSQGRRWYTTLAGKQSCLVHLMLINQRSPRALEWGWVPKLGQAFN